jgi:adenosylcobinamide kinase/adenosylcobinamide-phosphate guanylyltransferase
VKKIILITGGQRSGKSRHAQTRALELSPRPVYLATSRVWDEEHRARIARHRAERGAPWTTLEIEKALSGADVRGRVVVIDCVTLWATNFFFDNGSDVEKSCAELTAEFDRFTEQEAVFIFVTNEIGMGEMSQNAVQRRFADLQGRLNQYIAARADEVVLMVSGIPVRIAP